MIEMEVVSSLHMPLPLAPFAPSIPGGLRHSRNIAARLVPPVSE